MNQELSANTTLSHYRIVARLGAGGMGEVYLAEDERLRRKIALKVLPDTLAQDGERLRRFEQEALAASALNHPNILTIHEFGAAGKAHFLAAEFIDGETLRARIQRTPLTLNEVLDITLQTAQALAAAHEVGIIHRDIKPENVMLRKDGIVKVLDFGLAKLTEVWSAGRGVRHSPDDETLLQTSEAAPQLTMPGTVMGTVAYMSPEQARGQMVDARTDLFSLGVMLYEMLTRRQPFTGETVNHVIVAILEKEPPPLAQDIPVELARILRQMLAKKVADRYPSAEALLADLKKLQKRLDYEAEYQRDSSVDDSPEAQTLMLKQATDPAPEALVAAAGGAPLTTSGKPKTRKWWLIALFSLLALIGGFFAYRSFSPGGQQIDSLAVLPFQNRSANADSEYLSDGLAESLIYRLSQLPHLRVSPTSSVFRYKGRDTDPLTIGKELGVSAVMTGRIAQRGESLVISVELVDVRDNKTLWGEQYDRKLADLLATQREIATEITQRLQLKLSGEEQKGLNKRYTENNEAYQLYLKGRYHFAKRTKDDIRRSIEYYKQAISLDPNYALAYAGIADSYNAMPPYPYLSPKEATPQAKAAAQRALELDPQLAEAHTALANSLAVYDWNWAEAEREFKRALELNPNDAGTHWRYGMLYLQTMGRFDEAIAELKRALELEPLSLNHGANLAGVYVYARRNDLALDLAQKTYDLEPSFVLGRWLLSQAYIVNGMYAEAIGLSEKSLQTDPTNQSLLRFAGYANAKSGRRREAEEIINKFKEIAQTQYVMSYRVAAIYVALGEKEKAFAELEAAFAARDWELHRLKIDPFMDPLRDDPRFNEMLKRMHLPE